MVVWESMPLEDQPAVVQDYAGLWRAADKVIFSGTLDTVASARTRIEKVFEPAAIRAMKESATRPISVGGATLAAAAIRANLVDEFHQFIAPVIVGGGTRYLPDGVRQDLELLDEQRFGSGTVHLHYRTRA
jgi:riboflavin biosynthesis pyrimidine reductase